MNDRAWSATVPDRTGKGLRIGSHKAPVGPKLRVRVLVALVAALGACVGIVRACWRGDLPLWMATLVLAAVCSAVNPLWSVVEASMLPGPSGKFELAVLVGWAATLWAALAWSSVVFWRSLVTSRTSGGSALVAIPMLIVMAHVGANAWSSARQMSCYSASLWRETLAPRESGGWNSRALVKYDEPSRTLWIRGALELGASEEFRTALLAHPATLTVGLDSPGGYVEEGRRMAQQIIALKLDTYAPERCASACIELFAAGERRWAGQQTMFGFHRSGHECMPESGMKKSDIAAANFLRERGVADDFVLRAFETPYTSIWKPDIRTVLYSGLATGMR